MTKLILLLLLLSSCTKERDYQPDATCHFVSGKIYETWPPLHLDTTYFLWMQKDTVSYPMGSPPGHVYRLEVSKVTYDTIVYPRTTKYCY